MAAPGNSNSNVCVQCTKKRRILLFGEPDIMKNFNASNAKCFYRFQDSQAYDFSDKRVLFEDYLKLVDQWTKWIAIMMRKYLKSDNSIRNYICCKKKLIKSGKVFNRKESSLAEFVYEHIFFIYSHRRLCKNPHFFKKKQSKRKQRKKSYKILNVNFHIFDTGMYSIYQYPFGRMKCFDKKQKTASNKVEVLRKTETKSTMTSKFKRRYFGYFNNEQETMLYLPIKHLICKRQILPKNDAKLLPEGFVRQTSKPHNASEIPQHQIEGLSFNPFSKKSLLTCKNPDFVGGMDIIEPSSIVSYKEETDDSIISRPSYIFDTGTYTMYRYPFGHLRCNDKVLEKKYKKIEELRSFDSRVDERNNIDLEKAVPKYFGFIGDKQQRTRVFLPTRNLMCNIIPTKEGEIFDVNTESQHLGMDESTAETTLKEDEYKDFSRGELKQPSISPVQDIVEMSLDIDTIQTKDSSSEFQISTTLVGRPLLSVSASHETGKASFEREHVKEVSSSSAKPFAKTEVGTIFEVQQSSKSAISNIYLKPSKSLVDLSKSRIDVANDSDTVASSRQSGFGQEVDELIIEPSSAILTDESTTEELQALNLNIVLHDSSKIDIKLSESQISMSHQKPRSERGVESTSEAARSNASPLPHGKVIETRMQSSMSQDPYAKPVSTSLMKLHLPGISGEINDNIETVSDAGQFPSDSKYSKIDDVLLSERRLDVGDDSAEFGAKKVEVKPVFSSSVELKIDPTPGTKETTGGSFIEKPVSFKSEKLVKEVMSGADREDLEGSLNADLLHFYSPTRSLQNAGKQPIKKTNSTTVMKVTESITESNTNYSVGKLEAVNSTDVDVFDMSTDGPSENEALTKDNVMQTEAAEPVKRSAIGEVIMVSSVMHADIKNAIDGLPYHMQPRTKSTSLKHKFSLGSIAIEFNNDIIEENRGFVDKEHVDKDWSYHKDKFAVKEIEEGKAIKPTFPSLYRRYVLTLVSH